MRLAVRQLLGIGEVEADVKGKMLTVQHSPSETNVKDIQDALKSVGYKSSTA